MNNKYEDLLIKSYEDGSTMSTPIISLLHDDKGKEQLFTYLLRIKEEEVWGTEEEKRLILGNHYLQTHGETDNNGYIIPWKTNALKSIIVGHSISLCNKELIRLIAKEKGVKVYEAIPELNGTSFHVRIEEIF